MDLATGDTPIGATDDAEAELPPPPPEIASFLGK